MDQRQSNPNRSAWIATSVAIALLCAFQLVWALKTRDQLADVQAAVARVDKSVKDVAALGERLDAIDDRIGKFEADQGFLVDDVNRIDRKIDGLVKALENRDGDKSDEPPQPPALDWTEPSLFEAARKAALEVGISLTADEVRVPARLVLREGTIEYFAVLKGGKEHETLLSLIGNIPKTERRPKDFGVRLNNAIQALGFKRGKAVRYGPSGVTPPQGEPVYLFIEWEEKGEKVLVRAEDLIWNRVDEKPMERGKWVYVGSMFVPGDDPGKPLFAADLEGEAVATYSSPGTIIDNTTKYDADDTVFLVATPRMPEEATNVALLIRRKDREPTRVFPDIVTGAVPAGDPPPGGVKDVQHR